MTHPIRNTIVLFALASLPGLAFATGSQAGDNGRLPVGADNEGPRMAIPGEGTEAGVWRSYDSNGYYDPYRRPHIYVGEAPYTAYVAPPATYYVPPTSSYNAPPAYYVSPYPSGTYYRDDADRDRAHALSLCDNRPLAERPACRDAVVYGRY